jgi:hypothetical protein
MCKKFVVGLLLATVMTTAISLGVTACGTNEENRNGEVSSDLKPVIYLYPAEDNTEVSVSLDYNGNLQELIPEFNAKDTWNVVANKDGKITCEGKQYDYLFWEGDPNYSYDFYSGFCVKGCETEKFLENTLPTLGLNESETKEFIEFWLPQMKDNHYNMISFQYGTYTKNAKLTVSPEPDSLIRVFMAWYPSDRFIKINPQYLDDAPARKGFTVVEWGGNKVN